MLKRSPLFQFLLLSTREKTHGVRSTSYIKVSFTAIPCQSVPMVDSFRGCQLYTSRRYIKQKYRHFDTCWNWVWLGPSTLNIYIRSVWVYCVSRTVTIPDYPQYPVPNADLFCISIRVMSVAALLRRSSSNQGSWDLPCTPTLYGVVKGMHILHTSTGWGRNDVDVLRLTSDFPFFSIRTSNTLICRFEQTNPDKTRKWQGFTEPVRNNPNYTMASWLLNS